MSEYYILDGKKLVEVETSGWVTWFETANRRVKYTVLSHGVQISTVFLGLNHQWGNGPPLLFETIIFGGKHSEDQWRYSTWDEAVAGHDAVVDKLTWGYLLPLVQRLRRVIAWTSGGEGETLDRATGH